MAGEQNGERVSTLIIGGGQAGLALGYELMRQGDPFLIVDGNDRIGDAWRKRWDSLRLFTPARFSGLAGMPLPAPGGSFVGKDAMADYLEAYARRFRLPVRTGVRVDRLTREGDGFVATAGGRRFEADQAVVAMSHYQTPKVPTFADRLGSGVVQVHSADYRNPGQLVPGGVLVVGVGNSGADIALEVVKTHRTWISGQESGHIPFRIETFVARHLLIRLVRFLGHRVLTVRTPVGRRMRPKVLHSAAPLVRVKPKDLVAAGIERVGRVVGVEAGKPRIDDGRLLEVSNVIWCTGFRPDLSWIQLPVLDADGEPRHDRGITAEPGFYFLGLKFLYAMTSDTITGVGRDAKRIARAIAMRSGSSRAA